MNIDRKDARAVLGATLLSLGLLGMLASYIFVYGFGIESGLIAAGAAPLLIIGVALHRTWLMATLFLVGMTMGCSWIYAALTWQ